ncbi:hypothetical protein LA080_003201 [Diaporthe eres]|nr:hypothetical protein LA080_003201 [Diaporthe eres]
MSKCSICDVDDVRPPNPRLCGDCQDWDDLQHVSSCREKQDKFAHLNPALFCYKHNPWWPPMRKNNYSHPKDMKYRQLEDFTASGDCMICEAVRDALQAHITADTNAKIAVWKPFVYDPCDDHRTISEEVAVQQGMLPTSQNRCTHDHGPDCNALRTPTSITLPPSFRLEDTTEWCVVAMPDPDEYVALSYVWALASNSADKQKLQLQRDNVQEMESPGGLKREVLPEVIVDAIQLCAELGQRYLWIDRLCVVQDDLDTKAEQLDAMGVIYHRAFLTIVALGDGVTRGLPGVSSRPRPKSYENYSWDLLATMRNPMGEARIPWVELAVQNSKWNERAWTFQERFLSRRRLFFDEGQVYGNCCKERWSDNTDGYRQEDWMKTAHWQDEGLNDTFVDENKDSLAVCTGPLQQYTPRSLTFQEDILNAFVGVGNILRSRLNTNMLCGHPEKFFLESLIWIPGDDGGKRRHLPDIPSWSWASWEGGVEWTEQWAIGIDTYLAGTSGAKAGVVDFFISDPKSGIEKIVHRDLPLSYVRKQCRWWALAVIKNTDPECVAMLPSVINASYMHLLPRTESLTDISEGDRMQTAFRVLEEHETVYWWPPLNTESEDEQDRLAKLDESACSLAANVPNSLVFNTSFARLLVKPTGISRFFIPPRRRRTAYSINSRDGEIVGITMRMRPGLADDLFDAEPEKEYAVFVLGVGTAKRQMRKTGEDNVSTARLCEWYEWVLLVVIADEDEQGVFRRLAIGSMYPDMWVKTQPEWRTVVLA